jgi:hypothetical protein
MTPANLLIYPTFEENFYCVLDAFCFEVVSLDGQGVLTRPLEGLMEYFVGKYCGEEDVVKLREHEISIKINKKLFNFEDFSKNIGNNQHNPSYDSSTYIDLMVPFDGNGGLLFIKPQGYKTSIKFSVADARPPSFISVQKRFEGMDEDLIDAECRQDISTIRSLAESINKEYLEMGQQFAKGILRLASHPTKKFSKKKVVLDHCFSYLVFNPVLSRIFDLSS